MTFYEQDKQQAKVQIDPMTKKPKKPKPLFIDDVSKIIFYDDNLINTQVKLPEAFWVPALGLRDFDGHCYISGATEAGKSVFIRKMVNNDKKHRTCILFTDLQGEDPVFDGMDYKKYGQETSEAKNTVNADWLSKNADDKIMIFDDVQFNKEIIKYRDFMLEKGRHIGTIVVCVNHKLQDYYNTKVPLNEARFVVTFPCSNRGASKRYLKHELELDPKFLEYVLTTSCAEGRQLIVHKFAPNCIACSESIFKI